MFEGMDRPDLVIWSLKPKSFKESPKSCRCLRLVLLIVSILLDLQILAFLISLKVCKGLGARGSRFEALEARYELKESEERDSWR